MSDLPPPPAVAGDAAPAPHRDMADWKLPPCEVTKAYRNEDFLNSSHARHIRILAEYEETMQRLRSNGVRATIMFFGSARAKDRPQWDAAKVALTADKARAEASGDTAGVEKADGALERLGNTEWMIEWMDKTRDLARRVTEWSITTKYLPRVSGVARERRVQRSASPGPDADHPYKYLPHSTDDSFTGADAESRGIYVCTGGGPGFMEAANRGASEAPGGRSIGMGITLPFEEGLNPYVSKELGFEYHYFFTRKFWMAYHMQALVVAPGGFGTLDELFEIMTLKQTGKMNRDLPIVLLGESYWRDVLNWERFAKYGTISSRDVDELFFTDSVDDAFAFVTEKLDSMAR